MFESLSDKLKRTLKNLRGEGVLTKEHVDAALREIRLALLEADVNYKVAKDFIASVKEKAEGQQVWQELKPSEQVVKIVFDELKLNVDSHLPELGETVGDALLRTHRSYLPVIKPLLGCGLIKGMAHITGGGITDNLPRILPAGTSARVNRTSWRVPAIFRWLGESGRVPEYDLRRAMNMGIGMILVVAANDADAVRKDLLNAGEANSVVIGDIVKGDGAVEYV